MSGDCPWRRLGFIGRNGRFLRRLFVQSAGESLARETSSGLIDFHADELWQRTHIKPVAAE
jgi:hypothetical protein